MRRLFAVLPLALVSAGCGNFSVFGYTTHGLYPDNIRTIAVPIFHSDSFRRDLEFKLTEETIKRLERVGFKVVDADRADTELHATINPGGGATKYHFEYATDQEFKAASGAYSNVLPIPDGELAAGKRHYGGWRVHWNRGGERTIGREDLDGVCAAVDDEKTVRGVDIDIDGIVDRCAAGVGLWYLIDKLSGGIVYGDGSSRLREDEVAAGGIALHGANAGKMLGTRLRYRLKARKRLRVIPVSEGRDSWGLAGFDLRMDE